MRCSGGAATAGVAALVACGPLQPDVSSDRLVLMAVLRPDSLVHRVSVANADSEAELPIPVVRLYGRAADGEVEWTIVAEATEPEEFRCWNTWGHSPCYNVPARLNPRNEYMVEASADGFRTAWGVTSVVGDFEVEKAVLSRSAAPARLEASWTASGGAYRYFASLRRLRDYPIRSVTGWYVDVEGTSLDVEVPASALARAVDPVTFDVVAVSEGLHGFLTTGTPGVYFQVLPRQNVVDGFGFVGSLRSRSLPVVAN